MGNNKKKVIKRSIKSPFKVYISLGIFALVVFALVEYRIYNKEEKYLVNEGTIEYTTSGSAYIIKNETLIDIDTSKLLSLSVSEGSRVSKNNIVAAYRELEYKEYQAKLAELDAQILNAMKDINIEYSVDISNLERQVVNNIQNSQGVSSVIEMEENKNNINSILSRRAYMIGELSPKDAYVKSLIDQRKKLQSQIEASASNIKAPIGGIVSYTVDGLEDKLKVENVFKLSYDDVKEYVSKREEISSSKIRITSNYEAYILARIGDVDTKYIEEGKKYQINVVSAEHASLYGEIVKKTETEEGCDVLFRVTNGVENIVDIRECEIEIVWTSYEGLIVPIKAITEGEDGKSYVKIITRGEYIDIPVNIDQKNDTYAIVSNYERENPNQYILERYDQVVIMGK